MLQQLRSLAYLEAVLNCLVPVVDIILLLKLAQRDLLCKDSEEGHETHHHNPTA
jgi:hypothetical protein